MLRFLDLYCGQGGAAKGYADYFTAQGYEAAMGIHWMDRDGLAQSIPPTYTAYLSQFIAPYLQTKQEVTMPKTKNFAPLQTPAADIVYTPIPGDKHHKHYKNSTVRMYDQASAKVTVSVWVPLPSDSRFNVCRVCGKAQGRYGRLPKPAPSVFFIQPDMFSEVVTCSA